MRATRRCVQSIRPRRSLSSVNRRFSGHSHYSEHEEWYGPDYSNGFPQTDPTKPDYDMYKDPFNPESFEWGLGGPMLEETDADDPRRAEVLSEIPLQYKSVTQQKCFFSIKRTLEEFHRGNKDRITMNSRFVEDLELDSLDINELSVIWEYEFNIIGSNRGSSGGGDFGGDGKFNDIDVLKWKSVGDVVEYLCELPTAWINEPISPDHDECYEWDHMLEPTWGKFTERIDPDDPEGRIIEPNYNPSGLPEFANVDMKKRLADSFNEASKKDATTNVSPLDPKGQVLGSKFGFKTENESGRAGKH